MLRAIEKHIHVSCACKKRFQHFIPTQWVLDRNQVQISGHSVRLRMKNGLQVCCRVLFLRQ